MTYRLFGRGAQNLSEPQILMYGKFPSRTSRPRFLIIRQNVGCNKKVGIRDSLLDRTGKPPEITLKIRTSGAPRCGFGSSRNWTQPFFGIDSLGGSASLTVH